MAKSNSPKTKNNDTPRILNIVPSKNVDKDWTITTASNSNEMKAGQLPESVDLRADWWKINNQGSTGSCVGWSLADSVLRRQFVEAKKLAKTKMLSVRFVWMASKEIDEISDRPTTFLEDSGTTLKGALDVVRKFGCVLEEDLSFKSGHLNMDEEDTFYSKATKYKIRSYYNLHTGDKILNWKKWLASHGPVFTCLDVDDTWYNSVNTNGKLTKYKKETAAGGHAIALVGYTKDHFIIRNSWGTTEWGDKGYGYASYQYVKDALSESYGALLF